MATIFRSALRQIPEPEEDLVQAPVAFSVLLHEGDGFLPSGTDRVYSFKELFQGEVRAMSGGSCPGFPRAGAEGFQGSPVGVFETQHVGSKT
jgi:hypothetical protein